MTKKSRNSKSSASKSAHEGRSPGDHFPQLAGAAPATPKREVTHEMVAKRAYEIYRSGKGGDQLGNWLRAERELGPSSSTQAVQYSGLVAVRGCRAHNLGPYGAPIGFPRKPGNGRPAVSAAKRDPLSRRLAAPYF